MKIVRFKGKFTDLIPDGWTFQKLFAKNYRQYHKTCDGRFYSQGCRIWQHHGGYLEIDNLDDPFHAIFVQKIIDGTIDEWSFVLQGETQKRYWLKLDTQENRILAYPTPGYIAVQHIEYQIGEIKDAQEKSDKYDQHYDRYRSFTARKELIDMLQNLVDKQWLSIEDIAYE